jgi:hypothetical protein
MPAEDLIIAVFSCVDAILHVLGYTSDYSKKCSLCEYPSNMGRE